MGKISRNNRNIYETYENLSKNKKTNENIKNHNKYQKNKRKIEKQTNKRTSYKELYKKQDNVPKQIKSIRNCEKNKIIDQNKQKL